METSSVTKNLIVYNLHVFEQIVDELNTYPCEVGSYQGGMEIDCDPALSLDATPDPALSLEYDSPISKLIREVNSIDRGRELLKQHPAF